MRVIQHATAAGVLLSTIAAATPAATLQPAASPPAQPESPWWIVAHVKARTIAISPDGDDPWRLLPDQEPRGTLSPDGSRVAFLGSPEAGGSALYVADVTDETPHKTKNIRQLTAGTRSIVQPQWTLDGEQIVFGTFDQAETAVFIVDPREDAADPEPRRLSAQGETARDPRPGPDGRVAFRTIDRLVKPYPGNLVVVDADGENRRVLADNTGISDLKWSPDGAHIAYSTAGSLVIVSTADSSVRELRYDQADKRLYAHYARALAWRPDGKLIAMRLSFAGGTSFDPNAPPPPPPFWDSKVFLIPIGGGGGDEPDPSALRWVAAPDNILDLTWTRREEAARLGTPMPKE